MGETERVKVVADPAKGLIMLSFGKPIESFAATPTEVNALASRLVAAAQRVRTSGSKATEFEETMGEFIAELKHEEKEAHGGD